MDPPKVQATLKWLSSTSIGEIHGFLGLEGYCKRFIHE